MSNRHSDKLVINIYEILLTLLITVTSNMMHFKVFNLADVYNTKCFTDYYTLLVIAVVSTVTLLITNKLWLHILSDILYITCTAVYASGCIEWYSDIEYVVDIKWIDVINLAIFIILFKVVLRLITELIYSVIRKRKLREIDLNVGLNILTFIKTLLSSALFTGIYAISTYLFRESHTNNGNEVPTIVVISLVSVVLYYAFVSNKFKYSLVFNILNALGIMIVTFQVYDTLDKVSDKMQILGPLVILVNWMIWCCIKMSDKVLVENEKSINNTEVIK